MTLNKNGTIAAALITFIAVLALIFTSAIGPATAAPGGGKPKPTVTVTQTVAGPTVTETVTLPPVTVTETVTYTPTQSPEPSVTSEPPVSTTTPVPSETTVSPTATNTQGEIMSKQSVIDQAGPRYALTETISSAEAKSRILGTGRLEGVIINGSLDLKDVSRDYIISDFRIKTSGSYGLRTKIGYSGVTPPTGKQVVQHCEISGATSANLYISHVTVKHCDVWGGIDNVKAGDKVEMYANYLHDQSWVDGAHADAIQIQYGDDSLFHWNVIDARYGDSSIAGARAGGMSNAGLQMGSMTRDSSARWHDNWFNGGHYTVRLGTSGPPLIDHQWRNNKFGRDFTYGPVAGTRTHSTTYGGVRFDSSNVWEDTGDPV